MPRRNPAWLLALALAAVGCRDPEPAVTPSETPPPAPAPVLSGDDEALLASLLAEDPSDFHLERARIWRIGGARWITSGPELPRRPQLDPRKRALGRPLEVVVVDAQGPRVLLPLDELAPGDERGAAWSALRLVAVLSPSDLVAGLRRELHPTPWLTLSAGVPLTPLGKQDDHLRVRWADPACGFALELALDTDDFGPRYEPGPAGPPMDPPASVGEVGRRLAPGTAIYAAAEAAEPVLRLDEQTPTHGQRMSAAQHVELSGKPARGRQPMTLRCRGVEISGWVERQAITDNPSRYAVVQDPPPPSSTCAALGDERLVVPAATPLYEPLRDGEGAEATLVGVTIEDVELIAAPGRDGWWTGCVGSPWGDLVFNFRVY